MQTLIERLRMRIPAYADGFLIQTPVNRRYLTGFKSSAGFLLILKEDAVFLTDFRYVEAAEATVQTVRVERYSKISETFSAYKNKHNLRCLLVEHDQMKIGELERMQAAFQGVKLAYDKKLDELISELRVVKTSEDIHKIRAAQELTEQAFHHILPQIRPGVTERELALEIEFYMRRQGAEGVAFDPIVVSGENSAKPHGVPTDKAIEKGDFVTMDTGAMLDGWHSDMTRTVAVGNPTDEQREIYEIVLRTQETAIRAVRRGADCEQVDAAARTVIRDAGYGEAFGHSTGHGVGMEIHEAPNLAPGSRRILMPGNVVTIEPGIYLNGKFGVRIEDMVVVTETGCKNLTKCPKKLIIL